MDGEGMANHNHELRREDRALSRLRGKSSFWGTRRVVQTGERKEKNCHYRGQAAWDATVESKNGSGKNYQRETHQCMKLVLECVQSMTWVRLWHPFCSLHDVLPGWAYLVVPFSA
jgi:hypothetical protein